MSFSPDSQSRFAKVFEKADFQTSDSLVKACLVQRGGNLVFGRPADDETAKNLVYIGKVIESNQTKNLLGWDAWLDVSFPHVIYITGTRGSGKSFDLGVLIEGVSELATDSPIQEDVTPICSFLIDTQSQFWTLGYEPNGKVGSNKLQLEELKRWNISPNRLKNVKLFIPPGCKQMTGKEEDFTIKTSDVSHEEWCELLGQDVYGPQGHILSEAMEHFSGTAYQLSELVDFISDDTNWNGSVADASRNAIVYKLKDYQKTGLFTKDGVDIKTLLRPGQCNVFMLRELRNVDKSLITAVIARQLFTIMGTYHTERKKRLFFDQPLDDVYPSRVWLLVDEAHVVAPSGEQSPAREPLIELVKRGRDAGLSLVLATQQPSAVDSRILSQVNVSFSHRLVFQSDIGSAVDRIPSKLTSGMKLRGTEVKEFGDMLRFLEAGQCFVGDHSTSRTILLQVRPRVTSHGGYSPV